MLAGIAPCLATAALFVAANLRRDEERAGALGAGSPLADAT
jgi:hypothetical protein